LLKGENKGFSKSFHIKSTIGENMTQPTSRFIDIPGRGIFLFPKEFLSFTGNIDSIEVHDARESPKTLHSRLADGAVIVLTGPYLYINGVYRYCMRFEKELVPFGKYSHISGRSQRISAFTEERRQKLHHLLLFAQGDNLIDVINPPYTKGLQQWLQEPTGEALFLIPLRRLQRILTDMRRAREGIFMEILGGTITILPHVYVPADLSVPAMFAEYKNLIKGKKVLDMGTGTGILAILAARIGADMVIATDNNLNAVNNANLNVERFGLNDKVEVRGPADLFDSVSGEKFDVILFNAPWIQGEPQTLYDTANYDPGYRVLDGFIKVASQHLTDYGSILLQYSDVSQQKGDDSIAHLHEMIDSNGFCIVGEKTIDRLSRVIGSKERVYLFEIRRNF
jgi:methylase of polypeptide subunit release factors